MVCQYSNPSLPAAETCPFKVEGILTLTPAEPAALQQGSQSAATLVDPNATATEPALNPDGTPVTAIQSNICMHTPEFMVQPGIEALIEQQRAEIQAASATWALPGEGVTTAPTEPTPAEPGLCADTIHC